MSCVAFLAWYVQPQHSYILEAAAAAKLCGFIVQLDGFCLVCHCVLEFCYQHGFVSKGLPLSNVSRQALRWSLCLWFLYASSLLDHVCLDMQACASLKILHFLTHRGIVSKFVWEAEEHFVKSTMLLSGGNDTCLQDQFIVWRNVSGVVHAGL